MAILKVSASKTTGQAALRSVVKYVLNEEKTSNELITGLGDFVCLDSELNEVTVCTEFNRIKDLFEKNGGRQYLHVIQAFSPNESNPSEVHRIGCELANALWPTHQVMVVTHTDKEHLHNHFIVNTVSYVNGRKIHWKKQDLKGAKKVNDDLCKEYNLSIPVKKVTSIRELKKSIWDKNLYNLMKMASNGERSSFVLDCAKAVMASLSKASDKNEFIDLMAEHGWKTVWEESKKYITFIDDSNHRIRDSKLSKVLSKEITKETLLNEFRIKERKCRKRHLV